MTKEELLLDIKDAERDVKFAEEELKSAEKWLMQEKLHLAELIIKYHKEL
jgi:hypothetical protein